MKRHWLRTILLAAVALRVAMLLSTWGTPYRLLTPDSWGYAYLSQSLTAEWRFEQEGVSEIVRTPGYPFFLVLGHVWGEGWWLFIVLLQIALDVLLVYLTYLLGAMLCGPRAGLWAAAFQAVSAVAIVSSVRILSDGLFAMLLTLAILLAAHHLRTGKWWSLLAAAGVTAAGCYFRATGLVFAAILIAVLLFRPRRLVRAGATALVLAATLGPWVARNALVADYRGFSALGGQVAYDCQAPTLLSDVEGISFADAGKRLRKELSAMPARTPGDVARNKQALGVSVLLAHPWRYAQLHARGDLGVWLPDATDVLEIAGATTGYKGTLQVLRTGGLRAAVSHYFGGKTWALALCLPMVLLLAAQYLLAALAVGRCVRLRMEASRWLVLLTVLGLTLIVGTAGHPRYRTPVEPLLSLAAGAGMALLLDFLARRRARRKETDQRTALHG